MASDRKPPSKALKRKFARNRVRRTVLAGQIERLSKDIDAAMRKLAAGSLTGAALSKVEKAVLENTERRRALQEERDSLKVRRAPKKGGSRRKGGSGKATPI